jgi:hypothetical protein
LAVAKGKDTIFFGFSLALFAKINSTYRKYSVFYRFKMAKKAYF